jgi:hypothetical protein
MKSPPSAKMWEVKEKPERKKKYKRENEEKGEKRK